ncbi:MAG: phenylalanine--tRNA ligase subunit beta [Thermoleophilaceae bacterium]
MRVPLTWLRSQCDPPLDATGIAQRLDLTGTELERVERVGVGSPDGFVVAKVLSAEAHPDADRLRVCTVDDGSGSQRTIVCGAPNVAAGQTVAVALPGAVMPDGSSLGEAKLRGVASSGMILAEDEVGIGSEHDGIMVLADALEPGSALADALPISDEVLELEITPNRPDCLSVRGIARELHAATGTALGEDPAAGVVEATASGQASDRVSIEIADPAVCRRFTGRVFEGVRVGPSPLWLKQRLLAAGQRPISNVVDITNYVMLATGQPLHAFDLDAVRGGRIIVRAAEPGERMTTLDDVERVLDPDMVLVADAEGPSGLAGVMGGQISEVSRTTTRVLMEAATWVPTRVLRTSKALGLRSEASTRFEKGLHPDNVPAGQNLAARLMVGLCGAQLVPGTIDVYPVLEAPRTLTLRLDRLERLLGDRIPDAEVVGALEALGFLVGASGRELEVTVPYWRDADVQREADLVEEVARIHGLEKLPVTLPARERAVGRLSPAQRLRRRLEDALRDRGLDEVVGWSFTAPATLEALQLGEEPTLALSNPLSEDQSVMRPLLLGGLLDVAQRNAARAGGGVALFESAHVYRPAGALEAPQGSPGGATPAAEAHHLAALLTRPRPSTWRSAQAPADFFAVKGLVEALGGAAGVALECERATRRFLHPGRSAAVRTAAGHELGWVGELHPLVARAWDLEAAAAFELDFDALAAEAAGAAHAYRDVTSFPSVRQDIAVVAPAALTAAEVRAAVLDAGGELLASAAVFDVYEGEQVGEGNRSLALALEFRARDRTLTEEEVGRRREAVERALAALGGRLRG